MEKGINLQIEEYKMKLAATINESHMPSSITTLILQSLLAELTTINKQQVQKETQEFEESKKETE